MLTDSASLPDLLAPWIDQFNTASANATTLMNTFMDAPGVGFQQMVANRHANASERSLGSGRPGRAARQSAAGLV